MISFIDSYLLQHLIRIVKPKLRITTRLRFEKVLIKVYSITWLTCLSINKITSALYKQNNISRYVIVLAWAVSMFLTRDAWRVAGVRTALIVGRSGDTMASTFSHWLLLFRHVVSESTIT